MAAKHRVTVNLTEEEYSQLSSLSEKSRVSLAWLGRQAIIEILDRHRNGKQPLPLASDSPEGRK